MDNNTPIPDAELAELRRLWAKCQPGQWRFSEHLDMFRVDLSDAFPAILARLEAAEREREAYHAALSEIYYRAIPLGEDSGHSTISHIAADAMGGKNGNPLAARDAQQRREGGE